jgi:hypothetical protein
MKKNIFLKSFLVIPVLILIFFSTVIAQNTQHTVSPKYVPGEVLVKYKTSQADISTKRWQNIIKIFAQNKNMEITDNIENYNIAVMKIQWEETVEQMVDNLNNDPNVEYAQPNYIYHTYSTPNDPDFTKLRWLSAISWLSGMNIFSWWSDWTWTIIAIIDEWVSYNHPDLSGNMRDGSACIGKDWTVLWNCVHWYDYIENDRDPAPKTGDTHGTHVAGTIWAIMNNNTWIVWVSPNASLMAIRAWSGKNLDTWKIIDWIIFAQQNWATIINASFWGTGLIHNTWLLYDAIQGFPWLFIAAAWNESFNNDGNSGDIAIYPCSYDLDNIICVAATDSDDHLAWYSNYGATSMDVWAPGSYIWSTTGDNIYWYSHWTSMATPHVVGLASLARSFRPDLSYQEIKNIIINSWDFLDNLSWKTVAGTRINVYQTLYALDNFWPTAPTLIFPLSGEVIFWTDMQFLWSEATDKGVWLSWYYFELSTWIDFQNIITWTSLDTTGITISNLEQNTYYWRVKAFDLKNNTWEYSETWRFFIGFNSILNAEPNTLYTSNIVTLFATGEITISIDTGEYAINSSWWETASGTINSWDTIQLRLTSPNEFNVSNSMTLSYWTNQATFTITTRNKKSDPEPFSFTGITNAELNKLYTSNIITISWLETSHVFTASITAWELIKNDILVSWLSTGVENGDNLSIRLNSSPNYSTTLESTLTVWSGSATFQITTRSKPSSWGGGWGWWGWWGWGAWWTLPTPPINTGIVESGNQQLDLLANKLEEESVESQIKKFIEENKNSSPVKSLLNTDFSIELQKAYIFAYMNQITTMPTIDKADLHGNLTRIAMAKMVANYVLSLNLQKPDLDKKCEFSDISSDLNKDYDNGVTKACQLGLMGVWIKEFNPNGIVSRAEFGTVLSRALRWAKYNNDNIYYEKHLEALKKDWIMTKIENPKAQELRGRVMLMLMRAK